MRLPGRQTKRHPEKGGKLNTSQAGSVAASRAAVGQFLSLFRVAFCLATRYNVVWEVDVARKRLPFAKTSGNVFPALSTFYNVPSSLLQLDRFVN